MRKNWVYYMQEGLRNMFRKKPKKKIKHEKPIVTTELYIDDCKCKDCGCKCMNSFLWVY